MEFKFEFDKITNLVKSDSPGTGEDCEGVGDASLGRMERY
jgi:hypothetical protein